MADWTQDAYEYLDGYLTQVSALAKRQGDDAAEIVSGLRDHIAQEVESSSGDRVDIDDLLAALAIIGTPEEVVGAERPLQRASRPTLTAGAGATVPPIIPPQTPVNRAKAAVVLFLLLVILYTLFTNVVPLLIESWEVLDEVTEALEETTELIEGYEIRKFANSPLYIAEKGGPMGMVEIFLDEVENIDAQDEFGKTALHYPAENGHSATAGELLKHGADANIRDEQGKTALDYAVANGHGATAGALKRYTTVDVYDRVGE